MSADPRLQASLSIQRRFFILTFRHFFLPICG